MQARIKSPPKPVRLGFMAAASSLMLATTGCTSDPAPPRTMTNTAPSTLADVCRPEVVQAVAGTLHTLVTIRTIQEDPKLPGGVSYVAASGDVPGYCQVTGSFVTNSQTGKTANFLATFPANWNGKYLQLGCGGHCGTFAVSNPATPLITITTQGTPSDILTKGYAAFATDEGHAGVEGGTWAVKGPGQVDEEAITDFLYRASKIMARMGKEFTVAFYH